MDQYVALSKKDLMLQITLNEIYNTHALLSQHLEVLVYINSLNLIFILLGEYLFELLYIGTIG
jgi:Ras GTPase-activating-like protein IQGAP2/3